MSFSVEPKYTTFEITLPELHAMSLMTSKRDVRYYLLGLAVRNGYLVATDGGALVALPLSDESLHFDSIIPNEAIDDFLRLFKVGEKKKKPSKTKDDGEIIDLPSIMVSISIDSSGNRKGGFIEADGKKISFEGIHTSLNWQRIIPTFTESKVHSDFNWEYMAKFQKMSSILGCPYNRVKLETNGYSAAKVKFHVRPDIQATLMPMHM